MTDGESAEHQRRIGVHDDQDHYEKMKTGEAVLVSFYSFVSTSMCGS